MKRILIIEDDVITREIYTALLKQHGYEVLFAPDVREGWEKMQSDPPQAVLLDLVMPDSVGLDFLRKVRISKGLKDLPLIVYTALFVPGLVEEAQQAGATRIFDKAHLSAGMLMDVLNQCLIPGQVAA